jgi:hypothetical protein
MKLYRVQLSSREEDFIYVGTEDASLIGTEYPTAVKVEYVGLLTIFE